MINRIHNDSNNTDSSHKNAPHLLPLWIKLLSAVFVALLVPVYWVQYGPTNFLWFSDIALFGSLAALWLEHRLIASTMAVAVLLPELAWNIDFFSQFILRVELLGLSSYMFDDSIPLFVRLLSLFHVALPPLLLWLLYRLGYDRRALLIQTALAWIVLPLTWLVTSPADNINWVYGLGDQPQTLLPPLAYLALLMLLFPLVTYLPTHAALCWLFAGNTLVKKRRKSSDIQQHSSTAG